jgi:hypothetical protein
VQADPGSEQYDADGEFHRAKRNSMTFFSVALRAWLGS